MHMLNWKGTTDAPREARKHVIGCNGVVFGT